MIDLGASEVIADEFESSIEIFTRVLKKYLIPRSEIGPLVEEMRKGEYEHLRDPSLETATLSDLGLHLLHMSVDTVRVSKESRLQGRSLADIGLRQKLHITVLLIKRGKEVIWDLEPNSVIQEDDLLVLFGRKRHVKRAIEWFGRKTDRDE